MGARLISTCVFLFALLSTVFVDVAAANGLDGQLTVVAGKLPTRLSVELHLEGRFVDRTYVNEDGSFRFPDIHPGWYEVRVLNMRGDTVRQDFVSVGQHAARIDLRVDGVTQERPANGSVSIRSLARPLPKDVRKQLRRAEDALRKGDVERSLRYLELALNSCADCPEVHNNLGVRYMRIGKFTDAVAAFRRAVELDPNSVLAQSNLAIALVSAKDYAGAETVAQRALELDHGSIAARYALGLSSLSRGDCRGPVLGHLQAAADVYARARLSAATVLLCRGDVKSAIGELQTYLAQPRVEHREKVEQWLANLRTQSEQRSLE